MKKTFHVLHEVERLFLLVGAVVCFLPVLTVYPVQADELAPSLSLKIENSLVDLVVDDMPLNKILESISAKTGIRLRATDQASELSSCHLRGVTLAEILEKLLVNWNYALLYKNDSHGLSVPNTLWIVNRNFHKPTLNTIETKSYVKIKVNTTPQQDHQKTFEQEDITEFFADRENILDGLSAETYVSDDQIRAVEITGLSSSSPLRELGLQEDDVIFDINGQPVTSATELVQALASSTDGNMSIIRIERQHDGEIDPIYIELH